MNINHIHNVESVHSVGAMHEGVTTATLGYLLHFSMTTDSAWLWNPLGLQRIDSLPISRAAKILTVLPIHDDGSADTWRYGGGEKSGQTWARLRGDNSSA